MKITAEYIKELVNHGEHSSVEMKKCKKSVPDSVWETYSAFANTRGGVILLGVYENKEKPLAERFEISESWIQIRSSPISSTSCIIRRR